MRLILFFFLSFLLALHPAHAQMHDNVWMLGEDSNGYPEYPGIDQIKFIFEDSLIIQKYSPGGIPFANTNTSICDSSGQLVLASNGCYIVDGSEQIITGSTGLNPGFMYNNFCADGYGYNAAQSMLAIPDPNNIKRIHFFHLPSVKEGNRFYRRNLLHTIVNRDTTDTTNWQVIQKNEPVVLDTFDAHGLHAVKHANGRDWWVLSIRERTNRFYFTLLTPDTLVTHHQEIGLPLTQYCYGQVTFSPDGSQLAVFDAKNDLRLYDFDRCSGTLSNFRHIPITDDADIEVFAGVAWSADSRFIYCSEVKRVLQFDVLSTDIAASMINIGERSAATCSWQPGFFYPELTPDGRIFVRGAGGNTPCLHIIQYPERIGEACNFQQNAINFSPISYTGLPHFPNFRLGPVDGSSCDTLGLNNHPLAGWRHTGVEGLAVDFTSVSWYNPESWQWDFGDGTFSTALHPQHTFPAAGSYEVCLTVSNEYGSDTKCKTIWVNTVSATDTPQPGKSLALYPNPTTGVVSWRGDGMYRIRVFNTLGQLVLEEQTASGKTDFSLLIPGHYRVEMMDTGTSEVSRHHIVLVRP